MEAPYHPRHQSHGKTLERQAKRCSRAPHDTDERMATMTSSNPRIVVARRLDPLLLGMLAKCCDLDVNEADTLWHGNELLRRCHDAHGLLAADETAATDAFLSACPHLRLLAIPATRPLPASSVRACERHGTWLLSLPHSLLARSPALGVAPIAGVARSLFQALSGDRPEGALNTRAMPKVA